MWRRNIINLKTFSASACKQAVINTRSLTIHPLAAQCIVKTQPLLNIGASSVRHNSQRSAPLTERFSVEDSSTENVNSFTYRTHTCGELRACNTGEKVSLCGWIQYLRLSKFLLLRDAYGIVQCTVGPVNIDFSNIPLESVVKIHGEVTRRPENAVNSEMSTGEIEVIIDRLEVLNMAENLPFNLREYQKPKEQIRMQHRYIDLRFPEMQRILRLRSQMLHNMRRFLVEQHGFVEVETPTLFCQTPGGAREFVVPTHHAGLFYSLVQSPQQFKQMLMSGGVDRYFQIARCYRDETTRPDRQPEFTQLDIEMSFTNLDGVLSMIESLLVDTFPKLLQKPPFRRMTYKYALENYGTDKPNVQYDLKFKNIKELFPEKANDSDFSAYALPYPAALGKVTTKTKELIKQIAKRYNVKVVLDHDIHKAFNKEFDEKLKSIIGNENASIISIGDLENACNCLGEIRLIIASLLQSKNLLKLKNSTEIFWLVDFPLFTKGKNGLETCHHPFTSPHPEDIHLLESDPLSVRSLAYDLVMNGNEIGGGSVRVHNVRLQEKLLKMLGMDAGKLRHFLNALQSGCPPHAGIALGIDRLVSIVFNTESIRDVIAFPKTHEGKDPLSGAPNAISDEDKEYYHIQYIAMGMKCSHHAPTEVVTPATAVSLGSRCRVSSCVLTAASKDACVNRDIYGRRAESVSRRQNVIKNAVQALTSTTPAAARATTSAQLCTNRARGTVQ